MLISNRNDLNQLQLRLQGMDIATYALKQRHDTKFKPVMVTNIVYSVYRTSFPLGISQGLPDYLTGNQNLITLEKNPNTGTLYKDNLCFFRCLAFHQTG